MASFTSAQLALEINTTRVGVYAPAKAAGDDAGIVALVNGQGIGGVTVWRSDLRAAEILGCLVEAEVSGGSAVQWARIQTLLMPGTIDATQPRIRQQFAGIFAAAPTTLANLTATAQKANPTRAEELWGAGVSVSISDVSRALGRG
jgi:hypothetical protein